MEKIFVPHELRTIEVDVEKKIFSINGEEFGKNCTGFTITCSGYNSFQIRVEVDATVQYATYAGINQISLEEHPVRGSWYR